MPARKARPQDAQAISALLLARRSNAGNGAAGEEIAREVEDCFLSDRTTVYISENSSLCAGYVVVHWLPLPILSGHEAYISDLLVGEAHRGRGIGTELMAAVEREARARGCCRIMLNNPHKSEAYKRGFYEKLGYCERTEFANYVKML